MRPIFILLWLVCAPPVAAPFPALPPTTQNAPRDARKQQALDKALIRAIRRRDAKSVRLLLTKGANPNARDLDGNPDRRGTVEPPFAKEKPTALLIVFDDAQRGDGSGIKGTRRYKLRPDPAAIVKALLEKGADPNVIDYDQTFPLLEAVQYRYAASVRLLLAHKANPNQTWVHGITPLHRAVSNRDIPIVKALLAAGADPAVQSVFDNPAHPLADEVAELLKAAVIPDRPNK